MQTTRLTLRTLLAFMDDIYDLEHRRQIERRLRQSDQATRLLHRIRDVMQQPRLEAPSLFGEYDEVDPNTAAEYLDHVLSEEQSADYEKICFGSDLHLAEVAGCHQILSNVLGEPAQINRQCRQQLYELEYQEVSPAATESETELADEVVPEPENVAVADQPPPPTTESPEATAPWQPPDHGGVTRLGESLTAMRNKQRRWRVAATISVLVLATTFLCLAVGNHVFTFLDMLNRKDPFGASPMAEEADEPRMAPVFQASSPQETTSGLSHQDTTAPPWTSPSSAEPIDSPPAAEKEERLPPTTLAEETPTMPDAGQSSPRPGSRPTEAEETDVFQEGSLYTKLDPPEEPVVTPAPQATSQPRQIAAAISSEPGGTDTPPSEEESTESPKTTVAPQRSASSVAFEMHQRRKTQKDLIDPAETSENRPPAALALHPSGQPPRKLAPGSLRPSNSLAHFRENSVPTPSAEADARAPETERTTGELASDPMESVAPSREVLTTAKLPQKKKPSRSVPLGPPTLLKKQEKKPSLRSLPTSPKEPTSPHSPSFLPDLPGYAIPPKVGEELSETTPAVQQDSPPSELNSEEVQRAQHLSTDSKREADPQQPSENPIPLIQPANFDSSDPTHDTTEADSQESTPEDDGVSHHRPESSSSWRYSQAASSRHEATASQESIEVRFLAGQALAFARSSAQDGWIFLSQSTRLPEGHELMIPSPASAKLVFPGGIEASLYGDSHVRILPRDEHGIHGLRVVHGRVEIQATTSSMIDRQLRLVTEHASGLLSVPDPQARCYVVSPDPTATAPATPMSEDLLLVSHLEGNHLEQSRSRSLPQLYAFPGSSELVSWEPSDGTTTIRMKESACIPLADGIAVEQTAIESPPAMKPSSEDLDGRDYLAGVVREAVSRNPAPAKFLPELSAHPSHSVRRLAYRIRANMADFRPLLQSLSQSTECESWKEITLLLRRSVRRTPEMRKNLKSQLTLFSETTAMELYRMWTMPLPASGEKWSESELAYLVPRLEHPRPEVRVTAMETLRLGGMTELTGNPVSDPNRWSSVVHRWKNLRRTAEGRFR